MGVLFQRQKSQFHYCARYGYYIIIFLEKGNPESVIYTMFLNSTLRLFFKAGRLKAESGEGEGEREAVSPGHTPGPSSSSEVYCMEIYPCKRANGTPGPLHNSVLSWVQFSARHGLVKVPTKTLS